MKRRLNFAVLLGLLVPAGLVLAQVPAKMALPTGGLNPPAMIAAKSPTASASVNAATAPVTAAPAQPVLMAAQPVISGTPGTAAVPVVAPAVATAGNPFDAPPATPAAPSLPAPVFQVLQKPVLPATISAATARPNRTALLQPDAPQVPNRIRDCLLKANDEVQLPAQEAGVLVELSAKEGHEVLKDQPLGRIDDSQPRLQRKAAIAEKNVSAEKSKSTINEQYALKASEVARKEFEKAEESNRIALNSVSQVEVMRLKLTWEKGMLERERAVEERKIENLTVMAKDVDVEAAEDAVRRRQLVAPINGTIVEITPHIGEWLKPGDPVLKIVNMEILRIEGFVNIQHHRQEALRNQTVDVEVDQGHQKILVQAVITFVSPVVEAGGDYRIMALIKNGKDPQTGDWILKPGLNADLILKKEPAKQ